MQSLAALCYTNARLSRIVVLCLLAAIALPPQQLSSQPLATGKDKFLGGGTSSSISRFFNKYWNQVTPGNAGKWGSVSYSPGQYSWTNLDIIYNYAISTGLQYKHHVLVWGSQQPGWVDGLDSAGKRAAVEDWIKRVGERYPKMDFVEVVNEPFHFPLPSYKNALGGDGTTGWDWVVTAFRWARKYCAPGVKLHLNEYGVLGDYTATTNYLNLIKLLKDSSLIDGIGIQGHYFEFRSHVEATTGVYVNSPATLRDNLNRLTATGLPVYITEFDIDEPVDSNQVAQYRVYFPIFWSNPGVKGITFWGYIQDDIWTAHPDTYLLRADGRERPALQWLKTYIATPLPPTLVSPVAETGVQRNPLLLWQSSVLATSYRVQVSDSRTFAGFAADTTVADTTLRLSPLAANTRYYWRVSAVDSAGVSDYSTMASFMTGDVISDIKSITAIPTQYSLSQNYPNPFNPTTSFEFQVSSSEFVSLKVLDVLGREVATLAKENRQPGIYSVHWNASGLPSGVYFYRLQAGTFVNTKKMILSK